MSESDKINVDSIISRLLEVRGSRPGKAVQLTEAEIRGLCLKVRYIINISKYNFKNSAHLNLNHYRYTKAIYTKGLPFNVKVSVLESSRHNFRVQNRKKMMHSQF